MWRYIISLIILYMLIPGCGNNGRNGPGQINSADNGSLLFNKYGCATCHSMEGEVLFGPPLNEIWHKRIEVIRDGKVLNVKVDRTYLIRSVADPGYEKALGYETKAMPKTFLKPEETVLIVDYIIKVNKAN